MAKKRTNPIAEVCSKKSLSQVLEEVSSQHGVEMSVAEKWAVVCHEIISGKKDWEARPSAPHNPLVPMPSSPICEQYFPADVENGVLRGPRRGTSVYGALFFAPETARVLTAAPVGPTRSPSKRGRKPAEWDPAMDELILKLIRNKGGLPVGQGELVRALVEASMSPDGDREGADGSARKYLLDHWEFLVKACENEKRPPGTTLKKNR